MMMRGWVPHENSGELHRYMGVITINCSVRKAGVEFSFRVRYTEPSTDGTLQSALMEDELNAGPVKPISSALRQTAATVDRFPGVNRK